jgi:DNA-binding SARP family transcriptional activator
MRLHLSDAPHLELSSGATTALAGRDAALLAWLAIEGPTARARLAALLWPTATDAQARSSLRQRLFQLRRTLGRTLVVGTTVLQLAPGVDHDLGEATELLGDLQLSDAPELEAWLRGQREHRHERERQALQDQADALEAAGDRSAALVVAKALLRQQPLSEAAHQRLMRLHYLEGDRAAALTAFDACEQVLKHDLGAAPGQETLALLAQIEAQSAALTVVRRSVPPAVLRPPRLIGRDREWAQLHAGWAKGQTLILTGEGGLGKTRLLGDFARGLCETQGEVIVVAARPGDARLPYALASRCLRLLLNRPGMVLQIGVRRELAQVLPELGEAPASSDGTRFVNAIHQVLELAESTGLSGIFIDDLYLADAASAAWLQQACGSGRLRWVIATRSAGLSAPVRALMGTLLEAGHAEHLDLLPLTEPQVAELLVSLALPGFDAADWAAPLHRRSGGNPMFLLECVKTLWADDLRRESAAAVALAALPKVQQLILQRLLKLSLAALRLARCAAVAGPDFSAALAVAVLQVRPLDLSDAWAELEAGQVMRDSAFAHDLIHEAALASVPAPIARELHLEIAQWLQAHGGTPWRIASHWLDGREPMKAVPHLLQAAAQATARLRFQEACDCAARAGAILEQAGDARGAFDAYLVTTEVLNRLGSVSLWAPFADKMDALASNDTEKAYAGLARAAVASESGQFAQAAERAQAALACARRAGAAEAEAELEWILLTERWEMRDLPSALGHGERALALRRRLDPARCRIDPVRLSLMLSGMAVILAALGRFAESRAHQEEA